MSFITSVLFGSNGSYNILGRKVSFEHGPSSEYSYASKVVKGPEVLNVFARSIGYLIDSCLKSPALRILTLGYAHSFVSAMTTSLVGGASIGERPEVRIFTNLCMGGAIPMQEHRISPRQSSVICASGPMADMFFSGCQLTAAVALREYISKPVAVTLGAGALTWMAGHLFTAYATASNGNDNGEFAIIAKNGSSHLAVASIALVAECALGLLAAYKFM